MTIFFVRALWAARQWKAVYYLIGNMQFSAAHDVRLKNYRARSFSRSPFKHGLIEGSTFLFQYSFMTRAPLGSCRLGELNMQIHKDRT